MLICQHLILLAKEINLETDEIISVSQFNRNIQQNQKHLIFPLDQLFVELIKCQKILTNTMFEHVCFFLLTPKTDFQAEKTEKRSKTDF